MIFGFIVLFVVGVCLSYIELAPYIISVLDFKL